MAIWQVSGSNALALQVDDLFILGNGTTNGDILLSHHMLLARGFAAANDYCKLMAENGLTAGDISSYYARRMGMDIPE